MVGALQHAVLHAPQRQRRLAVRAAVGGGDDVAVRAPVDDQIALEQALRERAGGQVGGAGDGVPLMGEHGIVGEHGHAVNVDVRPLGQTIGPSC